jgi:hypothetical protein
MWNVYMETGTSLEPGPQGLGIWKKKEGVRTRIAKSEEPNSQTHTQRTPNLIK